MKHSLRPADTLTPRELEIASLIRLSNEEIGRKLRIRTQTVKNHIRAIMERTGMGTRMELACYFCNVSRKA